MSARCDPAVQSSQDALSEENKVTSESLSSPVHVHSSVLFLHLTSSDKISRRMATSLKS